MDIKCMLLDSWDRQARIVQTVASLLDETSKNWKPSDDGMPLHAQLAHMHQTRTYFLAQLNPQEAQRIRDSYSLDKGDLAEIKKALEESSKALRNAVETALNSGQEKTGWYDNPVLYIQHMIWHEGWHVGLIFLALRLNGQEPPEEWEETNVWGEWRTEEW